MRLLKAEQPELPVVSTSVVLANVSPKDFRRAQRRSAALESGRQLLYRATLGAYNPRNKAERLGWRSEAIMLASFKDYANKKLNDLLAHDMVSEPLRSNGHVVLEYRSGGRAHSPDGTVRDASTIITADAEVNSDTQLAIGWCFDVANGIPSMHEHQSRLYFQTQPVEGANASGQSQQRIVAMGAINLETGRSFSAEDFSPMPYREPYHEIAFYDVADRLYGFVESGISFAGDGKITSVVER